MAFGVLSGGIGAELSGGNFWEGAVIGGIVAGLNHVLHAGDDNGCDREGRKVDNRGGDTIDYMYDDNGNIISSTPVQNSYSQFPSGGSIRGYGHKWNPISPALKDPSFDIFTTLVGGGASLKGVGIGVRYYGGKYAFTSKIFGYQSKLFGRYHSKYLPDGVKGSLNTGFIRIGWSNKGSQHVFRTAIGHKGSNYHKHIDWFSKFILFPLIPFASFRRNRKKISKLFLKMKEDNIYNDFYFQELLKLFLKIKYDKLAEGSDIIISKDKEGYYIYASFYSKYSIPINISYNMISKEIYLSVSGSPTLEGNVIYEYDRVEKYFSEIEKWLKASIKEKIYYDKYDHILRIEYLDDDTNYILFKSTEISYYWRKITRIEEKEYKAWVINK